jgi:hypothetical protein
LQTILGAGSVATLLLVQSWLSRRFQRQQHEQTNAKLEQVETTVNGTNTALTARVEQLAQALVSAGVAVPPSPTTEDT